MNAYVLGLQEIDRTKAAVVGGKGANLGELSRIEGIRVPAGFCITTDAYEQAVGPSLDGLLERLSLLEDPNPIRELGAVIRGVIEGLALPDALVARVEEGVAYAVRSSATAEDLPTASFAGQHDTYLNVIGKAEVLRHVRKCWASLFTDRAVAYRHQQGFDHRQVQLAVVVQEMVFPRAAGVMFTADPLTSNRKVVAIDASFGLGEALVAGLVTPDNYQVRNGEIGGRQVATTKLAIQAVAGGGTATTEPTEQDEPALTDGQVLELARFGRTIEAHFGCPQDIEWCLADGAFHIVQSRPITTLFPIPEANDGENHVYVSVGHQQMMTDAFKPLGLSIWQLTAVRPMAIAGGRLFVDVAAILAKQASREAILDGLGSSDPLIKDALLQVLARGDFIALQPDEPNAAQGMAALGLSTQFDNDPRVVTELIEANRASLEALRAGLQGLSGAALLDAIAEDFRHRKEALFDPRSTGLIIAAQGAATWLNQHVEQWLGEKGVAGTLSQSVPNNITSEMGLALLDVADALRPHPEAIAYLQQAKDETFFEGLSGFPEARAALQAYLARYGMRGAGEIDVTRPRWAEKPTTLVPMILTNLRSFEPGAGARKFEQGRQEALNKETELLARLRQLPDGEQKATQAKQQIDVLRTFAGYREYPKYGFVCRYFLYRQALLEEADRLVQAGVLQAREDVYYLTFEELRAGSIDPDLIRARKADFQRFEKLTPPRVMTSDGEIVTGRYKRANLPPGALVGLAVSAGMVEGRARVISRLEDAEFGGDDILVTAYTDPSWTPSFVAIKGLVTEVGGLMTHGAVIAREYGLPAIVGLAHATRLIKDGQRIRVNATEGYVEIL